MKILILADEECKALWDYFTPDKLEGIDLIVSCGDLKAEYLEFLVTMGKVPVLYVPGNHDSKYTDHPPEGCENIDGSMLVYVDCRKICDCTRPRIACYPQLYICKFSISISRSALAVIA